MKKIKFPYTVRVGSATAKIYHTPNKGRDSYTVNFYNADGSRQRRLFISFKTAKDEAENLLRALLQGNEATRVMSDLDRLIYDRASDFIKEYGIPLDHAAREYAEAMKLLEGNGTLLEAVRQYQQFNSSPHRRVTVREAVNEMITERRANKVTAYYVRDLTGRLGRFADAFECPINSITTEEIERYLKSLKGKPRTIKNERTTLKTFFNFAKAQGFLPAHHPGVRPGPRTRTAASEIALFSAEEIKALLAAAKPKVLPALAIGAFAGVRSEEIKKLDWREVHVERGIIKIKAEIAKTRVRRLAPLPDNLRDWLAPYQQSSGPVLLYKNFPNEQLKTARAANVKWKRNAMRKSFISCRVSLTGDIARTALESGNSPKVILSDYLEAVDKATAEAWFNIRPGNPS